MSEKTKRLRYYSVKLGCDPELFISYKDKIVESGKFISKSGISIDGHYDTYGKITTDGVQVEFNPMPAYCRESLSIEIARAFWRVNSNILMKNPDTKLDFTGVIEFTTEDLQKLSDDAKQLGCAPSLNLDETLSGKIKVDNKDYKFRSAGGHIHLGVSSNNDGFLKYMQSNTELIVSILDIVTGNTCVLLDRDPMQVKRREVYGRAGEYRLPSYGIEYRTLSNFWLRSYPLTSLILGLGRSSIEIAYNIFINENGLGRQIAQCPKGESYFRELLKLVDRKDIVNAINNNDFDLAYANFNKVKKFLTSICPPKNYYDFPITPSRLKYFEYFVKKGISYWFPEDPVSYWCKISNEGLKHGWENFCSYEIGRDYRIEHGLKEREES